MSFGNDSTFAFNLSNMTSSSNVPVANAVENTTVRWLSGNEHASGALPAFDASTSRKESQFRLAAGSPGQADSTTPGRPLNMFNQGGRVDMGAHQSGWADMEFGVGATWKYEY